MRKAVCVGVNDYPGKLDDLLGCVNDATDWAGVLKDVFRYDAVDTLIDKQATREAVLQALGRLVREARAGDAIAMTFAGHGTWEPDREPLDEADGRDEAWCAVDGNLLDDALRESLQGLRKGVRVTLVSDSCHSGTVTRNRLRGRDATGGRKPRFKAPRFHGADAWRLPRRRAVIVPDAQMPEVLLTGCAADEYSYDAEIDGRYNGAFSYHAIALLRDRPHQTYRELLTGLRKRLPSASYPQTPQLEGNKAALDRRVFV